MVEIEVGMVFKSWLEMIKMLGFEDKRYSINTRNAIDRELNRSFLWEKCSEKGHAIVITEVFEKQKQKQQQKRVSKFYPHIFEGLLSDSFSADRIEFIPNMHSDETYCPIIINSKFKGITNLVVTVSEFWKRIGLSMSYVSEERRELIRSGTYSEETMQLDCIDEVYKKLSGLLTHFLDYSVKKKLLYYKKEDILQKKLVRNGEVIIEWFNPTFSESALFTLSERTLADAGLHKPKYTDSIKVKNYYKSKMLQLLNKSYKKLDTDVSTERILNYKSAYTIAYSEDKLRRYIIDELGYNCANNHKEELIGVLLNSFYRSDIKKLMETPKLYYSLEEMNKIEKLEDKVLFGGVWLDDVPMDNNFDCGVVTLADDNREIYRKILSGEL